MLIPATCTSLIASAFTRADRICRRSGDVSAKRVPVTVLVFLPTSLGALDVDTDAVLFLVWPLIVHPGFRAISRRLPQQPMMSLGGIGGFVNMHSQRSHFFSPFIADRFEGTPFGLESINFTYSSIYTFKHLRLCQTHQNRVSNSVQRASDLRGLFQPKCDDSPSIISYALCG